jgi:ribosomal protein L7Ae-like RNA K-turn-binding protein
LINKKIFGLIGLAARARKVSFGADSVENDIKKRKVKLLILANDASDRTKEKFEKLGEEYNIPVIIVGEIETLSKAIGKDNKAIIGIEDINLSNEIKKIKVGGDVIG